MGRIAAKMVGLAGIALIVIGCEAMHAFSVHNATERTVFLRVRDVDTVWVFEVSPGAIGSALVRFGWWEGGPVEILDEDCDRVATIPTGREGAEILVDASGAGVAPPGSVPRQLALPRSDRCGANAPTG